MGERERGQDSECQKKSQGCNDVLKWKGRSGNEKHDPGRFPWNLAPKQNETKTSPRGDAPLEGLARTAKQADILPASSGQEAPSKARIRKPIRSSTVRKAGMEAWTTGPSVQEALRGKLRKEGRDSEEFRRGGKEAEAGSSRNTEVSSLSIALSL